MEILEVETANGNSKTLIGVCSVDSGMLVVADPCYISKHLKSQVFDNLPITGQLNFPRGHAGAGIVFSTEYGDGQFGVYAVRDADGLILRIEIDLTDAWVKALKAEVL